MGLAILHVLEVTIEVILMQLQVNAEAVLDCKDDLTEVVRWELVGPPNDQKVLSAGDVGDAGVALFREGTIFWQWKAEGSVVLKILRWPMLKLGCPSHVREWIFG